MNPQTTSRKRSAPGASTTIQRSPNNPQQSLHPLPSASELPPMSNEQFLGWGQGPADNTGASYSDPNTAHNANAYGGLGEKNETALQPSINTSRPQIESSPAVTSTQLTRRPANQQLMPRPRAYENTDGDFWAGFGDVLQTEVDGENVVNKTDDDLEQKALVAKRDAQAKRRQIPPFIQKLRSFLDESRNTDLIRWSDHGNSFIVLDEDEFAKSLIPELFKHNKYASFVRQLNMYGFHKKVGLSDNSMRASERKNKSPSEYSNPFFKRGQPDLLWLINKPKNDPVNRTGRGGKTDSKGASAGGSDFEDDVEAADSPPVQVGRSQALSSTNRRIDGVGPLAQGTNSKGREAELAEVRRQLQAIQTQQRVISNAIHRLQKDHDQFYTQAHAFQNLHDRHESSINAILTFLATVYNRSLEGHGTQNFANMFANAIPQDVPSQRGVVDFDEEQRRYRKSPLLLGAPHPEGQSGKSDRAATMSPATSTGSSRVMNNLQLPSTRNQGWPASESQTPREAGAMEELFDNSPNDTAIGSPQVKAEFDGGEGQSDSPQLPERDIMSMINFANANANNGNVDGMKLDFPAALTHYQNANGNSPLTPKQRNDMLNIMAQKTNSADSGANNALVSPNPPQIPNLAQLNSTRGELDMLTKLQAEQDAKVQELKNMIEPLSPSGSIPGLTDGVPQYYGGSGAEGPGALDIDQIFDSGDYFGQGNDGLDFENPNTDATDNNNNNNDTPINFDDNGEFNGFGFDGVHDDNDLAEDSTTSPYPLDDNGGQQGRIVETEDSSKAASPAATNAATQNETYDSGSGGRSGDSGAGQVISSNKRRRVG
ncbi:MAG: stress-responsive transcription factor hsf1 [Sclerophora amabilis]|nr:MAG: stress-responsive transcription factor hsf1 [Sclerophora amabilis]